MLIEMYLALSLGQTPYVEPPYKKANPIESAEGKRVYLELQVLSKNSRAFRRRVDLKSVKAFLDQQDATLKGWDEDGTPGLVDGRDCEVRHPVLAKRPRTDFQAFEEARRLVDPQMSSDLYLNNLRFSRSTTGMMEINVPIAVSDPSLLLRRMKRGWVIIKADYGTELPPSPAFRCAD